MQKNELRIGNLVYHNHSLGLRLPAEITEGKDIDMFNEFEGIPLNDEYLINFGFVKNGLTYDLDKLCISVAGLQYNNGRTYFNSWAILEYQPKYVHQLQNLYFALTQKELILR